ncbi:MAG: flagellar export protein FliJ [Clostridiales bacterium]|jgi:flagellar FliJ protein|nr:flagellar export protein FliJ [Clostridiales bacterium]
MAFRFRLGGLLGVREKLENQKKNEYGRAVAELERQKHVRAEISERQSEGLESFRDAARERPSPGELLLYGGYMARLRSDAARQDKAVSEAARAADERREELIERMRDRKALETLRDRKREEYNEAEKRSEQKISDEVGSYRFFRGE